MKHIKGKKRSKPENIITSAVFVLFIFSVAVIGLIAPDKLNSETENRPLQQLPQFSLEKLFNGKLTSEYEAYVQDQFPARDSWISAKNYAELALAKIEINGIFIGKDGYFIENHPKNSYISDTAKNNAVYISNFANKYSEILGAEHISVMLVPTAQTVMTNKLPDNAFTYNQEEYIYSIANNLSSGIFVDAGKVLSEYLQEQIYYRTDHHWTTLGAYYAYAEWARQKV